LKKERKEKTLKGKQVFERNAVARSVPGGKENVKN